MNSHIISINIHVHKVILNIIYQVWKFQLKRRTHREKRRMNARSLEQHSKRQELKHLFCHFISYQIACKIKVFPGVSSIFCSQIRVVANTALLLLNPNLYNNVFYMDFPIQNNTKMTMTTMMMMHPSNYPFALRILLLFDVNNERKKS